MRLIYYFLLVQLFCYSLSVFAICKRVRKSPYKKPIDQNYLVYYAAIFNGHDLDKKIAEVAFRDHLAAYSSEEILSFMNHFSSQISDKFIQLNESSMEVMEFDSNNTSENTECSIPFYVLLARYKHYSYHIVVDRFFPCELILSLIDSCEQHESMNSRHLANIMHSMRVYNPRMMKAERDLETIEQTVSETKDLVSETIVMLMLRGEKLEVVKGKAIELDAQANKFAKASRKVYKQSMKNKMQKLLSCCFVIVLVGGAAASAVVLI